MVLKSFGINKREDFYLFKIKNYLKFSFKWKTWLLFNLFVLIFRKHLQKLLMYVCTYYCITMFSRYMLICLLNVHSTYIRRNINEICQIFSSGILEAFKWSEFEVKRNFPPFFCILFEELLMLLYKKFLFSVENNKFFVQVKSGW